MCIGVTIEVKGWSLGVGHGGTLKKAAQNVVDNWRRGLCLRGTYYRFISS